MAQKALLGSPEWGDLSSIAASQERSGFPATQLQRQDPSKRWETNDVNGILSLNLDRGEIDPFSLVGMIHHNGSSTGGWRFRAANNSASEIDTNPVADSAPLGPIVHLDGSDAASAASLGSPASWTIEGWFRPDHAYSHGFLQLTGGVDAPTIATNYLSEILATDLPATNHTLNSTTKVAAGQWVHVALTYDAGSTTARLIINGIEEDSDTVVTAWDSGDVCTVAPLSVERFKGDFNDVRVWDVARTPSQIAAAMNSLEDGTESNLVAAWPLTEGTGTSAANSVGGGDPLTLPAAARWGYPTPLRATTDQDVFDWYHGFLHTPLGIAAQFLQVDILDPANSDGRFRMGRLFVSAANQLTDWFLVDSDFTRYQDLSQEDRSELGVYSAVAQDPKRDLTKKFRSVSLEEVNTLAALYVRRGKTRDVLFVNDPEGTVRSSQQIIHGLLGPQFRISEKSPNYYRADLRIREL